MEGIDLGVLVRQTSGFTGADLAHLVDSGRRVRHDGLPAHRHRPHDDYAGLCERPQAGAPQRGPWFASARNIVEYGNRDGQYDDLAAYMKANKLL